MDTELQKPQVTEIKVRMDCQGCVQKIKKALHGINGIYDLYIDFPQQKLTIIGWVEPEKIVKAIRKARKIAIVHSHTGGAEPLPQPAEPPSESGGAPPPEAAEPPPPEPAPSTEANPPQEPPNDPPTPENPPPEGTENQTTAQPPEPKQVQEVHVVYHHPPDYSHGFGYGHSYGGNWNNYANASGFYPGPSAGLRHEPPPEIWHKPDLGGSQGPEPPLPVYVSHSYNTYKPSPYVTEYEHIDTPPQYTFHSRPGNYREDYRNINNGNSNNITSMFSEENPNACTIV